LTAASHTAGAVAEQAADRKSSKYTELSSTHEFQPVAVESHGPLSDTTASFLKELDRKITDRSGKSLEAQFLFQRVSVLVQRFNSILFEKFSQMRTTQTRNHFNLLLCF